MVRFRVRVPVLACSVVAAALLAACGTLSTETTGTTTTSTVALSAQHKPIDLFTHLDCHRGSTSSSLTFGRRQRAICIHLDTMLTLGLVPPTGRDSWGASQMSRSTNGDIALVHRHALLGGYTFVYRAVRPGIDFVHVLMLTPCPPGGCMVPGPPVPEAQWVIRVVAPPAPRPSPYPPSLPLDRGLLFSNVVRQPLRWGTVLSPGQARWVKFATGGPGDLWGVWDQGGYPNIYPVRSDDGGATWTEAGPQLATDWAGGGLYYVDHVIPVSPNAVVMVSNSIIDVTLDGGRHWFQSLNAADNWQMRACTAGENTICLRVGPASYARGLPKGSYALYVLETAHLRWLRFAQSLA